MPICLLETNLTTADVPSDLSVKLSKLLADELKKPIERISVTVSPGLFMCRGGSTDPTVTFHIWSIGVFSKENNPKYSNTLFEFFKSELPKVSEKRIVMIFHPIEPHDVSIRT